MKKVFVFLAVISVFLLSCGKKSQERTSTDQYFDQQMDKIIDQKQAIKNEYKLRMERKKLQQMWENYSDCDEPVQKKTELIEKKDTCCPGIVQNFFLTPEKKTEAPKPPKAPRAPKVSKPTHVCPEKHTCPTCPNVNPAPEKVKETPAPQKGCDCPETALPTSLKSYSRWELLQKNGCHGFKDPRGSGQDFRFASFADMVSFWDANKGDAFVGYKRDF